jgi:hypothetical protein
MENGLASRDPTRPTFHLTNRLDEFTSSVSAAIKSVVCGLAHRCFAAKLSIHEMKYASQPGHRELDQLILITCHVLTEIG